MIFGSGGVLAEVRAALRGFDSDPSQGIALGSAKVPAGLTPVSGRAGCQGSARLSLSSSSQKEAGDPLGSRGSFGIWRVKLAGRGAEL